MQKYRRKLAQYLCKKWYSLAIPLVVLLSACFCISSTSVSALTTVPTKTNFQGRLTNSGGNIMADGTYNMKFRLYTVGSGGSAVWSEDRLVSASQGVQLTNGLFSVRLGDVTPLPASLFASGSLYLEVELPTPGTATGSSPSWTEGAMTPRNQLATSAYAYNSETLDGYDSDDFGRLVANNTWSGTNAFNGSTVSIGEAANAAKFNVGSLFNVDTSASIVTISASSLFNTGSFQVNNNSPLFKNASDNATAFRIQDAGNANMFVADTSAKRVYIGDPTADANGVALVLDNKSGADPTGVAGAMYYNTTNGKFRCYQNGAWRDCTSSLQDGYNLSVGSTTPEIKLDSTRGGLDIQDADTTIGAGGLLNIRASNGSGLGSALFSVGNTGAITAQNSTDSTAAFTISRAGSGGSLLVADTSNSRVQIGNATADSTGVALVLDTKNSAGDPTGVDGAMYYNSSMKVFRCYQNGTWRSCIGGLAYANTSPSNTINNSTAEVNFNTTYTIPADECQPGKVYRLTARGIYSSVGGFLGAVPNLTVRVKAGTTVLGTSGAQAAAIISNNAWTVSMDIVCISTSAIEAQGSIQQLGNASYGMGNAGTVSVDTTTAQTLQLSAQWGTANAGNTIVLRQLIVESMGP